MLFGNKPYFVPLAARLIFIGYTMEHSYSEHALAMFVNRSTTRKTISFSSSVTTLACMCQHHNIYNAKFFFDNFEEYYVKGNHSILYDANGQYKEGVIYKD